MPWRTRKLSTHEVSLLVHPPRSRVLAAFAAVYVIWGSTYLAIRYAVETLPPFSMTGVRFLVAGALLYGWARLRGAARPVLSHWRSAAIVGGLLLVGGTGTVAWAEQRVASGIAALLGATVPLWIVLMNWATPGEARPSGRLMGGVALGLAGLAILIGPDSAAGQSGVQMLDTAVLLAATLSWAAGSLYSRHAARPASMPLGMGMEMLAGGALCIVAGLLAGEEWAIDPGAVSRSSLLALAYLIVFGSLIGFTSYLWLLRVSTPARVSTHAYVNPVVAVLLGWALAGEPLTGGTLLAAAVIVGAVVLITSGQRVRMETGSRDEGAAMRDEGAENRERVRVVGPTGRRVWTHSGVRGVGRWPVGRSSTRRIG
jgi:drug/metabolite transporter (DMT)-like permease